MWEYTDSVVVLVPRGCGVARGLPIHRYLQSGFGTQSTLKALARRHRRFLQRHHSGDLRFDAIVRFVEHIFRVTGSRAYLCLQL
jgi:hypothetical protein